MLITTAPIAALIREQDLKVRIIDHPRLRIATQSSAELIRFAVLLGACVAQGSLVLSPQALDAEAEGADPDDPEDWRHATMDALENVTFPSAVIVGEVTAEWPELYRLAAEVSI